jgi:cobalt-zinc-cadmium efflux system membrane fusion protein
MDRKYWIAAGLGIVVAIAALWWTLSREPDAGAPAPAEAAATTGPAEIPISAEQAKALSLHFAAAEAAQHMPVASLPATIVPPPNARVAVAAQLPGVVTRVFVVEGDAVRAGQTLATVSSRDMVSLGADLSRARARLDEAQAALREAQVDVDEHARLIGMANGGASGGGYTLTAPISGRISAMTIETGKALDPGAAPFVIDAAGELQAQAQLPERLVGTVQPGMGVSAGPGIDGAVLAVGTSLDPQTRSAMLTARFPAGSTLRAGQALTLSVMGPAPAGAVRVPGAAVAQLGGDSVVFVATASGVVARPVKLAEGGTGASGEVVVLSGLKPGERVAVSAVSELKGLLGGLAGQ